MDFDLPDREEIACALATLEVRLARQGQYDGAADVGSAHRLLRAADDEIASLRTAHAEAQREIEELRADRDRLEWLLQNERIYQPYLMNEVEYSRKLFTREHIDAARREETEREARRGE